MTKVAVLGPLGTYTHQAAVRCFGSSVSLVPFDSITATFEALLDNEAGDITHAVLPLENSSFGLVTATHDFLNQNKSNIDQIDKVSVKIQHMLMRSPQATWTSPQLITSHEQALGQCQKYLNDHFPQTPRHPSDSTAAAALYARDHPEAAAICSQLAGQLFGLDLVDAGPDAQGIQDAGVTNETTFGVFTRSTSQSEQHRHQ